MQSQEVVAAKKPSLGSGGGSKIMDAPRKASKIMDRDEAIQMKRQSSRTNVELYLIDGIPELYGVNDTDKLRIELREEGQAAMVGKCLEGGKTMRHDAAELLAQWVHDAPDPALVPAFVARTVERMNKVYGGERRTERTASDGAGSLALDEVRDPSLDEVGGPAEDEKEKKVCFTESVVSEEAAPPKIDRVSTGAVKVKFSLPEEEDDDVEKHPIKRKGTGLVTPQQLRALMINNYDDEDEDEESDEDEKDDEAFEAAVAQREVKGRATGFVRKAVCAETHEADEDWEPPKHEKTSEQRARLMAAVGLCFMFAALEEEQLERVIDAFEEVRLEEGSTVIREGDSVEDNERGLYVLEDGELHVHKGTLGHVFTYSKQGDLFGDLALLYNAPRAATVIAVKPSVVWCIDRATFNNLVKNELRQAKERRLEFLKSVEVLKTLDPDQLAKLVDVLRERRFGDGVIVIQEGDDGDEFFILEKGHCRASRGDEFLHEYEPGTYFGELALLENQKRAAQISTTMPSSLLSLDRASFDRILGPLKALMQEHAEAVYSLPSNHAL
jgi:cAMP-dependent protein kinase regulator